VDASLQHALIFYVNILQSFVTKIKDKYQKRNTNKLDSGIIKTENVVPVSVTTIAYKNN